MELLGAAVEVVQAQEEPVGAEEFPGLGLGVPWRQEVGEPLLTTSSQCLELQEKTGKSAEDPADDMFKSLVQLKVRALLGSIWNFLCCQAS